jgi:protein TonB
MKNQKHDQNSHLTDSKKSGKHDANLQKNSTLYFQVGLILCLLSAYIALEYNFEHYIPQQELATTDCSDEVMYVDNRFTVIKEVAVNEPRKVKPTVLIEPEIVDNDTPDVDETTKLVDELFTEVEEGTKTSPIDEESLGVDKVLDIAIPVNFVENVPVYPGCESAKNNKERVKCMSDKLTKLVQKRFDKDIAADEGLEGRQKIYIQFKILKNGEIKLVNSRAPHKALENEAARLTTKIPNMKPGIQNGKAVEVLYTLPIIFDVQ